MTTEGGETELDKTVIEQLNDPLVHIIRNIIDHGIELPDVRESAGKPREGTVHLTAEHSGDSVLIKISGDGAGFDPDAIREKALEKGIIKENVQLTEKEIFTLIFTPGFSTAKKVTGVSGRGVGMDVVKRAVESIGGTIEIDSVRNIGSTTTLRLPLTLAIIDGLLVKIGNDNFVIPLSVVEECIEMKREEADKALTREMIQYRERIIPYIKLRDYFKINENPPLIEQVIIVEVKGERIGFGVDHVIGHHQTVIKSLGRTYHDVEGISGATILGDGTVALILDAQNLIKSVEFSKSD